MQVNVQLFCSISLQRTLSDIRQQDNHSESIASWILSICFQTATILFAVLGYVQELKGYTALALFRKASEVRLA